MLTFNFLGYVSTVFPWWKRKRRIRSFRGHLSLSQFDLSSVWDEVGLRLTKIYSNTLITCFLICWVWYSWRQMKSSFNPDFLVRSVSSAHFTWGKSPKVSDFGVKIGLCWVAVGATTCLVSKFPWLYLVFESWAIFKEVKQVWAEFGQAKVQLEFSVKFKMISS